MEPYVKLELDLTRLDSPPTKTNFLVPIWWTLDGREYPEANWTDFALTLVQWWTAKTIELLKGANSAELDFMDGDFSLLLARQGDVLTVTCLGDGLTASVSFDEFVGEIKRANRSLIERLRDTAPLKTEVDRLNRGLSMLTTLTRESVGQDAQTPTSPTTNRAT